MSALFHLRIRAVYILKCIQNTVFHKKNIYKIKYVSNINNIAFFFLLPEQVSIEITISTMKQKTISNLNLQKKYRLIQHLSLSSM